MALEFLNDAYFAAKVGIGTESPGAVLEIRASSSNPYGALRLSTSSTKYWQFNTIYSSTNPDLFIAPNGGTAAMTLQATGNVGIGTTSPGAKLEINDTNKAINTKGNLFVSTTDTLAVDKGGQISLGGVWSGTSQIQFAGIAGRKENATSGNAGGYLQFSTTVSSGGNLTEKMRITSVGGISFGSTGTAYGTSGQVLTSAGNASPTWTTPTTGSVTSINTGGGLDGGPITGSGTIEVEYDAVSTNVLQSGFDYRNSTIVSGDYVMVSNPSATGTYRRIGYTKVSNLLAAGGGGGTVTGTGTAGTVTKWSTGGTGIEDGPITFSGNNSTFAGNVTVGNNGNINIPTASSGNANLNFDGSDFKITSNSSSANLKLETSSTTRLTIDSSGDIQFNAYGQGNLIGTPTFLLGTDGSGNVVKTLSSSAPGSLWLASGNNIYNTNSANVGIGLSGPETDLMIYDTVSEDPAEPGYATTGMFALNRSGQATLSVGVNSANVYWMSNVNRAFTGPNYYNISLNPLGGRVGIGTTSVSKQFTVRSFNNSTTTFAGFYALNESQGLEIGYAGIYSGGTNADVDMNIQAKGTGDILMTGSGNVGIGTTSPSEKLSVDGNVQITTGGNTYLNVNHGNVGFIKFTDTSIATPNQFLIQHNYAQDNDFRIARGTGGQDFVIDSSGNVGIGTDSPGANLDVASSTGAISRLTSSDVAIVAAGELIGKLEYYSSDNSGTGYGVISSIRAESNALFDGTANSGANLIFATGTYGGGLTDKMSILASNGNVGIGTTSPGYKLDVTGDARFGDGNNFNPLIQYAGSGRTAGSPGYSFVGDLNTGMFNPNLSNTLAFSTGGSERMRINSSGNVGIGTTSPDAKLDIEGDEASLRIKDTTSGKTWDWQVHSTYMEFGEVNVANNRLVIKNGGNVGIGTTDPQSKLQVAGGIQMADDAATAVAAKVGTLRYRTSGNNSYVDMCMQTAASTYAWINIVQNNW
jgi:fibronectin-binding autotransporter adhesin